MTYLYISTDLNTGSSGDIVATKELEAMQELAKENNESIMIFNYPYIHPVPNKLPDQPFLIDYLTLSKLYQIDINNVKLAHMYGGAYLHTIRYLKSKRIKVTYSRMAHDRKISIQEHEKIYGTGSYPFNHVKDDFLWSLYMGGLTEVDKVIVPGDAVKWTLIKEGVEKENIRIIPHGCNIPDENKIQPISNKSFNIGYLGASGPDKGLLYLIQAWSQLNYQDSDSTLIIAGRGSEQLEPFIKKYATGGQYNLLGYMHDVADFYNQISVYVQPSATEAGGMEIPEAMSYGRPVITSIGAGLSDCIRDGVNCGFVIPAMDSNAIKEKIQYFKDDSKEIERMGNNARYRSHVYSWDKIKPRYIELWNEVLANKSKEVV